MCFKRLNLKLEPNCLSNCFYLHWHLFTFIFFTFIDIWINFTKICGKYYQLEIKLNSTYFPIIINRSNFTVRTFKDFSLSSLLKTFIYIINKNAKKNIFWLLYFEGYGQVWEREKVVWGGQLRAWMINCKNTPYKLNF